MPGKITSSINLFTKGCAMAAFILYLTAVSNAQKDGGTNTDLLKVIHYTNVDVAQTLDSVGLAKMLTKKYSLASYLYSTTPSDSLSSEEKKFLDSIQLYIAKRYIAEKALEKLQANIVVTDNEAMAYYNKNKEQYSITGKATYIQAYIFKEDPAVIEKAKKQILKAAATPDSLNLIGDMKNSDYSIAVERNAPMSANFTLSKYIAALKPRQMSDLMQIEGYNSKCVLYVISRTDNSYRNFEEVKEDCRSRARAEKTEDMMQQLIKEAVAKYPVPAK